MTATSRREAPDRNLAMELVRVTEAGAMAAGRWVGRGDKEGGDGAAVDAMRQLVASVSMRGIVVIGEGEKDEAPMLYNGELVGARIRLISDGDVAGAIACARPESGTDVLIGIGGTPEGIIAAAAMRCLGGALQGKLAPKDDEEQQKAIDAGHDLDRILSTEDLV